MTSQSEIVTTLLEHLSESGFRLTAPHQLTLEVGAVRWRVEIEKTRLVPEKIVTYLGSSEVSDFVRRALTQTLNPKGKLVWFPGGTWQLGRYEQRAEAMPLADQVSIETHYSGNEKRQMQHQIELFLAHIWPLTKTVRSLRSYAAVLASDKEPFPWGTDHAVLRLAATCYLARRLDAAMPALPTLVERQFIANAADFLVTASMREYLELISRIPLETTSEGDH